MSWEFVVALIFLVLTALAFVIYRAAKRSDDRDSEDIARGGKVVTIILGFLTLLMLFFASAYTVPVRNVGIVTTFNNPSGSTTGSGLHFVWPWQYVEDFDASIQVSDHTGDKACTTVRIGSLATACVENRIQWQVLDSAAPKLYKDYKGDFNNLRNNLVETKIQNALNKVFATYNPLSQVNIQTGQTGFDGAKLSTDVNEELNRTIGSDIKIVSVSVPLVHHDQKTEDNIKTFQDVVAKARILDQQLSNAAKEKQVADLQKQFLTEEFIQNKCVDESVKMGVPPGLCLVGGGAIVNATK